LHQLARVADDLCRQLHWVQWVVGGIVTGSTGHAYRYRFGESSGAHHTLHPSQELAAGDELAFYSGIQGRNARHTQSLVTSGSKRLESSAGSLFTDHEVTGDGSTTGKFDLEVT